MSRINHDIRAVMSTVMIVFEGLAKTFTDDRQKKSAEAITAKLEQIVNLSSAILQFVRKPEHSYRFELVRILTMIDDVAADVRNIFPNVNIVIKGDDVGIIADSLHLPRVFNNLMRNAVQAGATSLTCHVMLERSDDNKVGGTTKIDRQNNILDKAKKDQGPKIVRVRIIDNGPGLPKRVRDNLFQPFVQSSKNTGTGLGLTIAKEIVIAHGGEITLQSSDQSGTIWSITFELAR